MNGFANILFSALICQQLLFRSVNAQQTFGCISTIESYRFQESRVQNVSEPREYIFCEGRTFNLGSLDINNDIIPGSGEPFFPLRSNVKIKCGGSGKRENNCIVQGGDLQVEGTTFFGIDTALENVIIEGFTFAASTRYSVWATKPGDITFIDCEWRSHTLSVAPVFLDYFNASAPETSLTVNFEGCSFLDNVYFGEGSFPALVVANGNQNRLFFDRCIFQNNDLVFNNTRSARNSFLIETSGPISLSRNCFEQNTIGVSPVVAYATTIAAAGNLGINSDGGKCTFISRFTSQAQFDFFAPLCTPFDQTNQCLALETDSPTMAPTGTPSIQPTGAPSSSAAPTTSAPSDFPTNVPSASPSERPTTSPSQSPSTSSPTSSPSINPTGINPTQAPTVGTTSPTSSPSAAPTTAMPTAAPTPSPTTGFIQPTGGGSAETSSSPLIASFGIATTIAMIMVLSFVV